MKQDLRDIFKQEREKKYSLKEGHEARFERRLKEAFPARRRTSFYFTRIAASVIVLLGLSVVYYQMIHQQDPLKTTIIEKNSEADELQGISLGDVSPDLKQVETYYVNSINLELSRLELSADNKVVVDDFMVQLGELNEEYKALNLELNQVGPNELTISALIKNLQLRLQLLLKLKEKLNQLKTSKNETVRTNQA